MRFLKKKYSEEELEKRYSELYDSSNIYMNVPYLTNYVHTILKYKSIYLRVSNLSKHKVPWEIVACIHSLECALNFNLGIHSGEYWNAKTKKVPKGKGPFASWEDAAVDALDSKAPPYKHSFSGWLHWLEGFNGYGYLWYHPEVNSPYLWSGTTAYLSGKYTSDGKFDKNAVSKQVGAVAILKMIAHIANEEAMKEKH